MTHLPNRLIFAVTHLVPRSRGRGTRPHTLNGDSDPSPLSCASTEEEQQHSEGKKKGRRREGSPQQPKKPKARAAKAKCVCGWVGAQGRVPAGVPAAPQPHTHTHAHTVKTHTHTHTHTQPEGTVRVGRVVFFVVLHNKGTKKQQHNKKNKAKIDVFLGDI